MLDSRHRRVLTKSDDLDHTGFWNDGERLQRLNIARGLLGLEISDKGVEGAGLNRGPHPGHQILIIMQIMPSQ